MCFLHDVCMSLMCNRYEGLKPTFLLILRRMTSEAKLLCTHWHFVATSGVVYQRSAKAKCVAKNLAGGLRKVCKEVIDKAGAATKG